MDTPPPVPAPAPPPPPPPPAPGARDEGLEAYHRVADTVGFVPNLRWKDNVIQAVSVAVAAAVGAAIAGLVWRNFLAAAGGAIVGAIAATFITGLVLMVLGWVRAAKGK